ncbi:nucleotidyltransferase domain-containing protein [Ectothiorhodospiraceae bacterium BW-2]|nr:nucleotidyltransferase domain-containing protein [Ectothiorhodospiraceae bacterium BW-2]
MICEVTMAQLQQISSRLQSIVPQLQAIYLFGSRADGSARSDSDWDLAILTPRSIAPVALW